MLDSSPFFDKFNCDTERGAARLAHYLGVVGVAGSNPAVPTPTKTRSIESFSFHSIQSLGIFQ